MRRAIVVAAGATLLLAAGCSSTPLRPPAGTTTVTYQGVSISAPAGWGRNQLRCGAPTRDTVVVNAGPQPLCKIDPEPRVSYVWLRSCEDCRADPTAAVARQSVRVSGHAARRGEDLLDDGRTRVVLLIADRNVVVVAVSSDPGVARGIIDSARLSG